MGTVFRKQTTRTLPPGAEIIVRKRERIARWKDRKGKTRTAPLTVGQDGSERVVTESPYFVAKYRDGAGAVCVVATGCRDETAARQVLADLERKAELVRSGVMTAAEAAIGESRPAPLADHLDAYDEHLRAKGVTRIHREDTGRYLHRLAADCAFGTLADLRREALERWLAGRTPAGGVGGEGFCPRNHAPSPQQRRGLFVKNVLRTHLDNGVHCSLLLRPRQDD
jgi:hypothetical protein